VLIVIDNTQNNNGTTAQTPVVNYRRWARQVGISHVTAWRWVKDGRLHPVNISGKLYLTQEDIQQFADRAKAGEFARKPHGCAKLREVSADVAAKN
jgi:hypothetical protein